MIKTILNLLLFWRRPAEKSQILIEPRRRAILSFGVQLESQEEENYPSMRFNRPKNVVGDCSVYLGEEVEYGQVEVHEGVERIGESLKQMDFKDFERKDLEDELKNPFGGV